MAERYLIDTCAVIKYLALKFPAGGIALLDTIVDTESNISFISVIELQAWNPLDDEDLKIYNQFISGSNVLMINDDIISKTIIVRRKYRLKIPDAIIAATSMVKDFTLVSDNDSDFKKVIGLKYLNPALVK